MNPIKSLLTMTIALSFIFCSAALADSIKERMKQRLPQIVDLKNKGIVGETNTGYLGFVTTRKEKQDVVAAENEDRKTIYTRIAKQQNVSTQLVQKRRAAALFADATKGHYYQNKAGTWIKK
ncbi:YdbL family protein [Desulfobacter latus]|uniref:YdbL family protein n=1 Tax=Desulfobacter latus TaxID=2292 RepID=A0A850SU73_9BACT|nr:YdbL family protein [Desulfobacter latus]NWH04914.1 YdbL family protein [Desulfobacter latus]